MLSVFVSFFVFFLQLHFLSKKFNEFTTKGVMKVKTCKMSYKEISAYLLVLCYIRFKLWIKVMDAVLYHCLLLAFQ